MSRTLFFFLPLLYGTVRKDISGGLESPISVARDGAPDRVATWQREIAQPLPSVRPISGRAVDFKLLAFAVTQAVVVEQLPSGSTEPAVSRFPGFPVSRCTPALRLWKLL